MPKSKDQYRKVRRARGKARNHVQKYKMKGKVAEDYIQNQMLKAIRSIFIVILSLAAAGCFESYSVTGPAPLPAQVCVNPSPMPLLERGPVELVGGFCK